MAPRVTSSSKRNKRGSAKPVTKGQNPQRSNRQSVSQATVTRSGGGLNKNTAKVTQGQGGGNGRPALPPGQRGGTPTKPSSSKPTPPRSSGGPVQPVSVRDMGKPSNSLPSGGARGLIGPGGAPPKAILDLLNKGKPAQSAGGGKGGRVNMGSMGAVLTTAGMAGADVVGTAAGNAIGRFLYNQTQQSRNDPRRNTPGGGSKPKKPSRPASDYEKLWDTEGGRGNYGLDRKPQPVAPLPPSVRRSSKGGSGSGTPSRGGTTQRKGSSSPSAASSSSTSGSPAKPGQKWNDFNPNRGTSKTNNPLMKDLVGRIKDREDRDQASKASKLTSKFNTESYFSGEKVDGSKVDTKAKINSTTSEYDKKKRRYGG